MKDSTPISAPSPQTIDVPSTEELQGETLSTEVTPNPSQISGTRMRKPPIPSPTLQKIDKYFQREKQTLHIWLFWWLFFFFSRRDKVFHTEPTLPTQVCILKPRDFSATDFGREKHLQPFRQRSPPHPGAPTGAPQGDGDPLALPDFSHSRLGINSE